MEARLKLEESQAEAASLAEETSEILDQRKATVVSQARDCSKSAQADIEGQYAVRQQVSARLSPSLVQVRVLVKSKSKIKGLFFHTVGIYYNL